MLLLHTMVCMATKLVYYEGITLEAEKHTFAPSVTSIHSLFVVQWPEVPKPINCPGTMYQNKSPGQ